MLLISWLGNLRGRLVFSQRAKRGGQTNRATASWVELCEPRFLLTLPDITEGMTESEIADAWADAEQDAEDELNDAISDLSDTADDMDTQFDTIGTAMRSGIAGAIGNQETQDGLAFAALDAQVLIIDAAFDAAVGPERDDYTDDLATFEDDFNDGADDASDEFGTDSTDANNTLNDDLTTAGNTYDSDVGGLQSTYNGIESTQRGILDTANTNAENDFNDDMDDANDQLTLDNTVADTFLTSSLSPFETIRDTNVAGLDLIYDSAVAGAAAVRDSVITLAAAGFAKTAAKGGADQDKRAALDLARKDFAAAMVAAFDNLAATRARPLSSFEQAAMSRLDTWGIGAMVSETLHWAWNEGLDDATNFVTGWADSLTGGAHGWVRQQLGIDGGVNYNSAAYAGGQIVGTVHSFFLGGAAGAVGHVGAAYTAARVITTTATVYGGIQAANNIRNGNGTFWDYLALAPAVGYAAGRVTNGLGIFRCFVGDTPVVIRESDNIAVAAAGISDGAVVESDGSHATFVILAAFSVSAGLLGKQALDNRQRRHDFANRRRRASAYDLNDPNRCDLPSGPPPEKDAGRLPVLSPAEFDELFDQLLTGNVTVGRPSNTSARRGSPAPAASGLLSQEESHSQTSTALLDAPNKESPMFAVSKPPMATPTAQRARRSKLGLAWMWGCLLLAGGFLWNGLVGTSRDEHALAAVHQNPAATTAPAKYVTKPIRDIRVGERVLARNPEVTDTERTLAVEPDPITWRHIELDILKADGSLVRVNLLRPLDWLTTHETRVDGTIHLDLEEMGASGPARVLAVNACPEIATGPGEVVTGTFSHSAGNVIDLHLEGLAEPIGTTDNHRFWSEDRHSFVEAGKLRPGETLRTVDGRFTHVATAAARPASHQVYNLEVNSEHVYFVTPIGVLAHNQYHGYGIFDQNGSILKFGVSRGGFRASEQSIRARSQLTTLANRYAVPRGSLDTTVLRTFDSAEEMFQWERDTVGFFRRLGHDLPANLLPTGTPFP